MMICPLYYVSLPPYITVSTYNFRIDRNVFTLQKLTHYDFCFAMDGYAIPPCLSITARQNPEIEASTSYIPINKKHTLFTGLNHIACSRMAPPRSLLL